MDIEDILINLPEAERAIFKNQKIVAIKLNTEDAYSDEHIELHFESGDMIKIHVTTRPSADTSFKYRTKLNQHHH